MGGIRTLLVPPREAWGQDWKLGKGNSPRLIGCPKLFQEGAAGLTWNSQQCPGLSRKEHTLGNSP